MNDLLGLLSAFHSFPHCFLSCQRNLQEKQNRRQQPEWQQRGGNQQAKPDFSSIRTMEPKTPCEHLNQASLLSAELCLQVQHPCTYEWCWKRAEFSLVVSSVWMLERPCPFWHKKFFQRNKEKPSKTFHTVLFKSLPCQIRLKLVYQFTDFFFFQGWIENKLYHVSSILWGTTVKTKWSARGIWAPQPDKPHCINTFITDTCTPNFIGEQWY